jgi:hypothetical protein
MKKPRDPLADLLKTKPEDWPTLRKRYLKLKEERPVEQADCPQARGVGTDIVSPSKVFLVTIYMTTPLSVMLVFFWVGIATYGDTLFKSAPSLASEKFLAGAAMYLVTSFFAFWTFKLQQWGWIILLWNSLSLALSLFLSVVLFSEPFTIRRRVASLLVLAAILLTE